MLVLAGTRQWWFALTSYAMGLTTWTLGLDTPAGRYAALAIFFAWGAARVALDLAGNADRWAPGIFRPRWVLGLAALLLGTMPLTAGFAGAWLLASSLAQTRSAAASTALAGGFVLAACGTGLHFAHTGLPATVSDNKSVDLRALLKTNSGGLSRAVVGLLIAVVLLAGGIVPGLWLPAVASMTGAATTTMSLRWWGIEAGPPWAVFPAVLLAVGALTLAGAGWLALRWAAYRSPAQTSSKLLPAAQERLERYAGSENASPPVELPVPLPAPTPAFSLSLIWLEGALTRLGALALDGCARVGLGLARLEGRYYMPLALVLMLVAVLALAR
jgi:hypothetical protein